jgi:lipoprotein-releasing system permease protein
VVRVPQTDPRRMRPAVGEVIVGRVEVQTQQQKEIENWRQAEAILKRIPRVRAVAPTITAEAAVVRGEKREGVQVYGAEPEQIDVVTPITKYLVNGHFRGLWSDELLLSYKVAQDLRVGPGDRVRLATSEGITATFTIGGVFDTGQEMNVAYIRLRPAQSLFRIGTAVRTILVQTDDLFDADRVADQAAALLPYEVKSWSRQYPQFVSWLGVYNALAFLVSGFSLVASAFAIAAVLIVSVLQKSKQIGILKSIGAKNHQILAIFLLEGFGVALIGSALGAAFGCGVVTFLELFKQPVTRPGAIPEPLFPSHLTGTLVAVAMLAAVVTTVLAAALPARRAARLNPVEVMR